MFERRRKQQDASASEDSTLFTVAGGFKPKDQEPEAGRGKQQSGFNPWCQRSLTRLKQVKNSFRSSINEIRAAEIEQLEMEQPKRKGSFRGFFSKMKKGSGSSRHLS